MASPTRHATPSRRELLRCLNAAPWAGGIRQWSIDHVRGPYARSELVVAVPARDESERIVTCLSASARAIELSGLRARLLLLVNGSTDDTAHQARMWARRQRVPTSIVEVDFAPNLAHAGAARRLALEIAGLGASPDTILLTTDADAIPLPGWVAANVRHLHAGAHLVCGAILPIAAEAAQLPARLDRFGQLEARYRAGMLELEHLLDPDPWNPWPHHGSATGASLAMRAGELQAIGGVPLVPCAEDRALAARMRANDLIVVHADDVGVEVSCRVHGRAAGGMADTIHYRMSDPDPWCDEAIQPAHVVHARLCERAWLRDAWGRPEGRVQALERLGVETALARCLASENAFEAAWERHEAATSAPPGQTRLRFSALPAELARLEALLAPERTVSAAAIPTHGSARTTAFAAQTS